MRAAQWDRRTFLAAGGLAAAGLATARFATSPDTASAATVIPPQTVATHPLDALTESETNAVLAIVEAHPSFPSGGGFFPTVMLKEPPKSEVLAWSAGQPLKRKAFANVYAPATNKLWEVVVDLALAKVLSFVLKPGAQPPIYGTEWGDADSLVRASAAWKQAIRLRNIDPDDVYVDVWAPGDVPTSLVPAGGRALRALSFFEGSLGNTYDRPIEGIVVTIDMNRRVVVDVTDTGVRAVNTTLTGNASSPLTGLKPLVVRQPEGPSFTLDGRQVSWLGWRFRVGWNQREGLVLYQVGWQEGSTRRQIIYRMALDEIYVPYALPDTNWSWRTAFDVGEYNLGQYSERLEANVDVPENAVLLGEIIASDTGSVDGAFASPRVTAIYEREKGGSLWARTDPGTAERDARFCRELVVTSSMVIGNYNYAVEYVFGLDGSLAVNVAATGTTLNRGVRNAAEGDDYGALVFPNISAPSHQHFFNFRIDFDVDGQANRLLEQNTVNVASSTGNAFVANQTVIGSEGFRDANAGSNRGWIIQSATKTNALGEPTAYAIEAGDTAVPYSSPSYPPLQRAPFAQHPLYVTRYNVAELYAAGDYPNQGKAGQGLSAYVADHQSVDATDLVVWYTAGFTHHPEPENFPVMNTETFGFKLVPSGFFDRNPALGVPPKP